MVPAVLVAVFSEPSPSHRRIASACFIQGGFLQEERGGTDDQGWRIEN